MIASQTLHNVHNTISDPLAHVASLLHACDAPVQAPVRFLCGTRIGDDVRSSRDTHQPSRAY
jgi:hypothetical protein